MRHYDRSPYADQEKAEERRWENAAYKEEIAAEQGDKAQELQDSLPQEAEAILSPTVMETFKELFEKNSDASELLDNCLYSLSLLEVERREAV